MSAVTAPATNLDVLVKFVEIYNDVFLHDGYGDIRVEIRILRRGQKEVIIHCGKQYRFLVDYRNAEAADDPAREPKGLLSREMVRRFGDSYVGPDRRRRRLPIDFPDRRGR